MKSVLIYIAIGAGVVLLIYGALNWSGTALLTPLTEVPQETQLEGSEVGKLAPDFDLPTTGGDRVRLSDFSNTPVIVVFWATWQGPSTDQIKILDDYLASTNTQGLVHIVTIDSAEDQSIVTSYVRRGGYQVPVLMDVRGTATESYNVKSLPTFYFINASGVVQGIYAGTLSKKMLVDRVEALLK